MGAELWYHLAPWRPDPAEALHDLQVGFLAENYDLPSLVQGHLENAREAVRATEADGDKYGILGFYKEQVEKLEEIAGQPLPQDPLEQIAIVRRVYTGSGQGIGNVLDVERVSDRGGFPIARKLGQDEIRRFCGTDRPTLREARDSVGMIHERLQRGDSVCFPVWADDRQEAEPIGWYFVGNTID